MTFEIISDATAYEYTNNGISVDCVIISITNIGMNEIIYRQNPGVKAICHVSFDDTEENIPSAVQAAHADQIVSFVNCWKDKVQKIVIHCDTGSSRSAGICAALMLWLNGSNKEIFDNTDYNPNMRCYRLILDSIESDNNGRIGGFESIQERPPYVVEAHKLLVDGLLWSEIQAIIGVDDTEMDIIRGYIHYSGLCHCVPVLNGVEQPPLQPMSYYEFKAQWKPQPIEKSRRNRVRRRGKE